MRNKIAIIIGAGAAGLSAAYYLLKLSTDIKPVIIEQDSCVGGLAKTLFNNGNGTDIGGHRFFTKNSEVFEFWKKFLPVAGYPAQDDIYLKRNIEIDEKGDNPEKDDKVFLKRKRFSRIYYQNHLIDYPIKLNLETIFAMGLKKTVKAGFSYLKSCVNKVPETNLETFMINRFGKVLYELFFEKNTQKIWGIHPALISKEWGHQRIKGISLSKVLLNALIMPFKGHAKKEISLIEEYYYPKYGSSQLFDTIAEEVIKNGGEIILDTRVVSIEKSGDKISSVKTYNKNTNEEKIINADFFLSSMPVKELIEGMNDVPESISDIALNLQYRDFILANFVCKKVLLKNNTNYPTVKNICPDSWIYLQDDGIKAGRLNIMNHFSPYIINDFKEDFVINLEYFCNEDDEFWSKSDEDIVDFAKNELEKLNIAYREDIKFSKCIRYKKAYPSYFGSYENFDKIKEYLNGIKNLYCIGRNGQHKYNNMDHSILSGIEAAKIIVKNTSKETLWEVNTDKEYQEIKYE